MAIWLARGYILVLSGMAIYGVLGLITLYFYWKHRHEKYPCPTPSTDQLPTVTIQLPIFNELFVVERLISAVATLDYPREKLQIQVLDDSTDATTDHARQVAQRWHEQGVNITVLHRSDRTGYKAGALEAGLHTTEGEFIAIFDADFCPAPDFLRRTIPHFLHHPQLGMLQARWTHLNSAESTLTRAQAIALDKHFMMEQTVRHRADFFPKFNGSGGIWRRTCMEDAGGWQADTVCEDLCLSTRAVLRGWECRFLNDVTTPAELPQTISAFKNQQARWAKGSLQCLIKFFWSILSDRDHSLLARLYAVLAMGGYFVNGLLLILLLLQLPLLFFDIHFSRKMLFFSVAGMGQPLLFIFAQQLLYRDWLKRLRYLPVLIVIAIGLTPSQCRAMLSVIFGRFLNQSHPFIRTPKGDGQHTTYRLPFDAIIYVELLLALYAIVGIIIAIQRDNYAPLFLLATCAIGFVYVAYLGLREHF